MRSPERRKASSLRSRAARRMSHARGFREVAGLPARSRGACKSRARALRGRMRTGAPSTCPSDAGRGELAWTARHRRRRASRRPVPLPCGGANADLHRRVRHGRATHRSTPHAIHRHAGSACSTTGLSQPSARASRPCPRSTRRALPRHQRKIAGACLIVVIAQVPGRTRTARKVADALAAATERAAQPEQRRFMDGQRILPAWRSLASPRSERAAAWIRAAGGTSVFPVRRCSSGAYAALIGSSATRAP